MNTPEVVLESVVTQWGRMTINWVLTTLGPKVDVVGCRETEDGFELVLEGDPAQVAEIIYVLGQEVK
jgi:hypothetical protein